MKIECKSCGKRYNIADDNKALGDRKQLSFPCPACKKIINVDITNIPKVQTEKKENKNKMFGEGFKEKILKEVQGLPPMPQILFKAREIVNDPYKSANDLANVLEKDQAMTTRVLKVANSAYYGLKSPVASVRDACVLLGEEALLMLITLVSSSKLMGSKLKGYNIDSRSMFKHSLAVAVGSKTIAEQKAKAFVHDAFSAGLIHDIGKLILDPYIQKTSHEFHDCIKEKGCGFSEAEKIMFGFDHAEIAYHYCINWNIPEIQATAVKHHHHPTPDGNMIPASILHVANIMDHHDLEGVSDEDIFKLFGSETLDLLQLTPESLKELAVNVRESVDQITDSLF